MASLISISWISKNNSVGMLSVGITVSAILSSRRCTLDSCLFPTRSLIFLRIYIYISILVPVALATRRLLQMPRTLSLSAEFFACQMCACVYISWPWFENLGRVAVIRLYLLVQWLLVAYIYLSPFFSNHWKPIYSALRVQLGMLCNIWATQRLCILRNILFS